MLQKVTTMSAAKIGVGSNVYSIQTQDGLLQNGHAKSYGSKPDATHVWMPTEGTTGNGRAHTDLNHTAKQTEGSTLTIHDIHYTVKVKQKACGCSSQNKAILKGIK